MLLIKVSGDWSTWSKDTKEVMKRKGVWDILSQKPITSIWKLEDAAIQAAIIDWLDNVGWNVAEGDSTAEKIEFSKPCWEEEYTAAFEKWERTNNAALTEIRNCCTEYVRDQLSDQYIAAEAWNLLERSYYVKCFGHVMKQTKAITDMRCGHYSDLDKHIDTFRSVKLDLHNNGHFMHDAVWAALFINSLDDSFEEIKSQWDLERLVSLEDVIRLASEHRNELSVLAWRQGAGCYHSNW